jgi:protein SCO1/2
MRFQSILPRLSRWGLRWLVIAAPFLSQGIAAATHDPAVGAATPSARAALATSQAALGRSAGDFQLYDTDGKTVRLSQFRGKPLVVSFIYTSCNHTCPVLTRHVAGVVRMAREALGTDSFAVVSVGFDSLNDTPERMQSFKRQQGIDLPDWRFLSADPATMKDLTNVMGFTYVASTKGFDHLAQTTVIDGDGVIYRQVYGESFAAPSLVEPLKELVYGNRKDASAVDQWIDGIRLFCTVYDPATGRYRFDYSVFIAALVGATCLGGTAYFLVRAWAGTKPPVSPV